MFKEFKEFAMKGNVLDMAIGIIIGAAFGKIVTSFVSDVLMPPLGLLLGKITVPAITAEAVKAANSVGKITGILNVVILILKPIIAVVTPKLRELLEDALLNFYNNARATENPWDDFLAEVMLRILGITIPD